MSSALTRLATLFVAPPPPVPGGPTYLPPLARAPATLPGDAEGAHRHAAGRPARARATRAAVIGGRRAPAFAVDLSSALAARTGRRCGVTAVWGARLPDPPRGHPSRDAERAVAALAEAGLDGATAGGRGVVVGLPDDPVQALAAFGRAVEATRDSGVLVFAHAGPRTADLDALLAREDVLVLATGDEAVPEATCLAATSLSALAVDARVVTVALTQSLALPRPLRHRAALREVLGAVAA